MSKYFRTEISKEIYDRAMKNYGSIIEKDKHTIWSDSQLYGYGIWNEHVFKSDDKYYVSFSMGDSCD